MHLPETMLHSFFGCKISNFYFAGMKNSSHFSVSLELFQCPFKVTSQIVLGPHRWRIAVSRRNAS